MHIEVLVLFCALTFKTVSLTMISKSVVLDKKTDFFWKYNITNYVGKICYNKEAILFDSYEGRAEVFGQNFSLVLKNVKHSDCGDYAAVVVGGQEQSIAEYKVIVQDPVSRAELTVDHLSSSSDSCNLTVTCSTLEFNISSIFRCDAQNCLQVEEKSLNVSKYFYSLTVYLQQDTIFCNHSNKVSWKANKKVIKPYCETKSGKTISKLSPPADMSPNFFLSFFGTSIFLYKRNKEKLRLHETTDISIVIYLRLAGKRPNM
uniref:Immunoglobulin subtype domain-containing protein n=1 Tax=Pundamilia nyererei TaxID=303518 RepID=A0A3B4F0B9_9CICH